MFSLKENSYRADMSSEIVSFYTVLCSIFSVTFTKHFRTWDPTQNAMLFADINTPLFAKNYSFVVRRPIKAQLRYMISVYHPMTFTSPKNILGFVKNRTKTKPAISPGNRRLYYCSLIFWCKTGDTRQCKLLSHLTPSCICLNNSSPSWSSQVGINHVKTKKKKLSVQKPKCFYLPRYAVELWKR